MPRSHSPGAAREEGRNQVFRIIGTEPGAIVGDDDGWAILKFSSRS